MKITRTKGHAFGTTVISRQAGGKGSRGPGSCRNPRAGNGWAGAQVGRRGRGRRRSAEASEWEEEGLAPSAIFFSRSLPSPQHTSRIRQRSPPLPYPPHPPAIQEPDPLSAAARAPRTLGTRGAPREASGNEPARMRPHRPGPPLHCPGGASLPPPPPPPRLLAPSRPRPAGQGPRARCPGGGLLARRALRRVSHGFGAGGGDLGRPRRGGGRSGNAAITRGPPSPTRDGGPRAARGRAGGWGSAEWGSGWGRGPAHSRSAAAAQQPPARTLATDREPEVTAAKRRRPRPAGTVARDRAWPPRGNQHRDPFQGFKGAAVRFEWVTRK